MMKLDIDILLSSILLMHNLTEEKKCTGLRLRVGPRLGVSNSQIVTLSLRTSYQPAEPIALALSKSQQNMERRTPHIGASL